MNSTTTNTDPDSDNTTYDKKNLRILQINLNKSNDAHLELLNNDLHKNWDIVLLQEPNQNYYKNIATARGFRQVYPSKRTRKDNTPRSGIWVSERLSTNTWHEVNVNDSPDITAIRIIDDDFGQLTIFNIYNDCTHDKSMITLQEYLTENEDEIYGDDKHVMWAGDFNRHHRMWDHDDDERLFTPQATDMAASLILMLSEWGMSMALPKGIRTLRHMRSKEESRPDNVFCTDALMDRLLGCDVRTSEQPPKTDHYPIATVFDIKKTINHPKPQPNFREVDWSEFRDDVEWKLAAMGMDAEKTITNEGEFNERVDMLTKVLQDAIAEHVPTSTPSSYARRWWSEELKDMKNTKKDLLRESKRFRAIPDHPAHRRLRDHMNEYAKAIVETKKSHWEQFLNDADMAALWIANKYLNSPVGDGFQACMPPLKQMVDGEEVIHRTNEGKANILGQGFFPKKPQDTPDQDNEPPHQYEDPLEPALPITAARVRHHIAKVAPHKAPGLDGIPNVVLKQCSDQIAPHLATIFNAVFELDVYHQAWRDSITCVLRKPGRPSYEVAKAYRPIALLSTIGKILSSIVADDISRLIETHELLPSTHFGGRAGRTTTDALHYLVMRIKQAWRRGNVVSVLFLDVEGAFPNAVTSKVLHNLRKRRIPTQYVNMIANMLEGRRTKLRFDDFLSNFLNIENGIGQGCPLSMIIYIIYNADMVNISRPLSSEGAVGYVDDIALLAEGDDFEESTAILKDMMERPGGGLEWSKSHNSRFEMSKVAIMHFSRFRTNGRSRASAPRLKIQGTEISVVESYKYLGILMDLELRWKAQEQRTIAKGIQWVALFKRLSRTKYGINSELMRHLYRAVGIPKITYAAEIWYDPPRIPEKGKKRLGSVTALTHFQRIQRTAALAITGALRSTAGDILDLHANLLPIQILLEQHNRRSYIRLCTLPESHMLNGHVWAAHSNKAQHKEKPYPLLSMAHRNDIPPSYVEKIGPRKRPPTYTPAFDAHIDESRKDSIENEGNDKSRIKIYTDGSGIDDKVGAAALMYVDDEQEPRKILHYHLGAKSDYSTYDAEWVGAVMAAWLIRTSDDMSIGSEPLTVFVDNQSVIRCATKDSPGPAQYLMDSLHDIAEGLRNRGSAETKFTFKWISAHSDVKRNERVDVEAKKAAHGESSLMKDLPNILHRVLPLSKSALVQTAKESAKKQWKTTWSMSPRSAKYDRIDAQVPPKTYHKVAKTMNRRLASALTQIRTEHIPLNAWLHKIKRVESKDCQQCNSGKPETVHHFLFACNKYKALRQKMDKAHKRNKRNLKKIFATERDTKILLRYVRNTERLAEKPPEPWPNNTT